MNADSRLPVPTAGMSAMPSRGMSRKAKAYGESFTEFAAKQGKEKEIRDKEASKNDRFAKHDKRW